MFNLFRLAPWLKKPKVFADFINDRRLKWDKTQINLMMLAILVLAAFLRLYRLPQTLEFLGDQGRDAITVANIFAKRDLVFIGPVTSVGNMYLGPLYYYLMAPWLWLTYPSPTGPAYAIAILSLVTTWLIYHLGKQFLDRSSALIASLIFASSATVVTSPRFSWNPNPAPFFSVLMVYFTWKAVSGHRYYWLAVTVAGSLLLQLHYLSVLAGIAAGGLFLLQLINCIFRHQWRTASRLLIIGLASLMIVIFSFTPLILFDFKHDSLNFRAFQRLLSSDNNFVSQQETFSSKFSRTMSESHGRSLHIFTELWLGKERTVNNIWLLVLVATFCSTMINWSTRKIRLPSRGQAVIFTYLSVSVIGTSVYQHTVFDHYLTYLFPVICWFWGRIITQLWRSRAWWSVLIVMSLIVHFISFNLWHYPLTPLGWQISDMQRTAQSIYQRLGSATRYNLVLLSGTGDLTAQNYRYFLNTTDRPPISINESQEVEVLFIIDEVRIQPSLSESEIYQIKIFPNQQPSEVYTIPGGPEITVLRQPS